MTKHILQIEPRKLTGRTVKKLRAKGLVPANLFGKNIPSLSLQLDTKSFFNLRKEVGESSLIYLQVAGEPEARPVIVREVTTHPVSGSLLHIAFNQVNLKEKVTAPVSLDISGTAPAEKDGLGIMVQHLQEIQIEALPTDIPESISVDVSSLDSVGSSITVSNLQLDSKVTVKSDLDAIVVKIEPLAAEEKAEAPVTPSTPEETLEAADQSQSEATPTESAAQPETKKD